MNDSVVKTSSKELVQKRQTKKQKLSYRDRQMHRQAYRQ